MLITDDLSGMDRSGSRKIDMTDMFRVLAGTVGDSYFKILKINLTTDTFDVIKDDTVAAQEQSGETVRISEYLSAFIEQGLVYKDDEIDLRRLASASYLSRFFKQHPGNVFWTTYRRKKASGYSLVNMEIYPTEEYTDDNQVLYLTVKDVTAATENAVSVQDVYQALCENYMTIANLNLKSGSLLLYRFPEYHWNMNQESSDGINQYERYIRRYIDEMVIEDDRDNVRRVTELSFVKKQLEYNQAYSCDFRVEVSGRLRWHSIKYAKMDKALSGDNIVIGVTDISNGKLAESDFYRGDRTVLIVEDHEHDRDILRTILENEYQVLYASDGEEALQLLKEKHEEIAIIISGIRIPKMDGYELLKKIKMNQEYSSIPVIAATEPDDLRSKEECLKLGAADYITKPYNPVIVKSRVDFTTKLREANNILHVVERDQLTGLYTKEFFFKYAEDIMAKHPERGYAIIASDIVGLRVYNERYGIEAGDELLRKVASLSKKTLPGVVLTGRVEGGTFAALLDASSYEEWNYEAIVKRMSEHERTYGLDQVALKTGIYIIKERLPVSFLYDRAKLAMLSIKEEYGTDYKYYDDKLRDKLNREHVLVETVSSALKERQFQVYYQPKQGVMTERTEGAEALVRWIHPELGFISPGDFIPLFEKNGFITSLDSYVFVQVCQDILRWKKTGRPIVPISVNMSRRDFNMENLAEKIIGYVQHLGLDPKDIHFEVTESAFVDNGDKLVDNLTKLHNAGFKIELDDFGTGYSSLTALSNIPLDVIKLDMSIIRNDRPEHDRNVLDLAMKLARFSNMETVQEGVETAEQVERLKKLGCDYIQGYFYSRPLPVKDFEEYLMKER